MTLARHGMLVGLVSRTYEKYAAEEHRLADLAKDATGGEPDTAS